MEEIKKFFNEVNDNIVRQGNDDILKKKAREFLIDTSATNYSYNFKWLGRPIIQFPQDMIAMQELIWEIQPDLVIETGIAHGGSLILYSSILELIGKGGEVLGIDIEIREHNRIAIEEHPMYKNITMIEGNAIGEEVASKVKDFIREKGKKNIMLVLDSNHTHEHVAKELELYSPLVTKGSYIVVFDTVIEDVPETFFPNRPWGKGDNPKTAVWEFLKKNDRFEIDKKIEDKILITVAPDGYLKCIKD